MDDSRIHDFERELWVGPPEAYRAQVDPEVVMVVPMEPFVLQGEEAIRSVESTPRWSEAELTDWRISRPQEGLIVVAYHVTARREEGDDYQAHCTSTYRRLEHEEWRVVQHQQTPPILGAAAQEG
jgi:hypothetical protein